MMQPWLEYSMSIQGWMRERELHWLYSQAAEHSCIAEVGVWKGRSTSALAAGTMGHVYAVDWWYGEKGLEAHYGDTIRDRMAVIDHARENLARFPNVTIVEGTSAEAARVLPATIDMLFLDGGHAEQFVTDDLTNLLPLTVPGALVCGHDWHMPSVQRAVTKVLGEVKVIQLGDIWWTVKE